MGMRGYPACVLFFLSTILLLVPSSSQLRPAQSSNLLLRIQSQLNFPWALNSWNRYTDFCYGEQSPYATVVCYEGSITQLHIVGNESSPPLPKNFSMDSLVTTLAELSDLKVLSLVSLGLWGPLPSKISRLSSLEIVNMSSNYLNGPIPQGLNNLSSLQTLIFDHNMFSGRVPEWLGSLSLLAVLSLKNNSLIGPLPVSTGKLESLRVLVLSWNHLSGDVPDLGSLVNLLALDLEGNGFGPQFPRLGKRLVTLVLRRNRFIGSLPEDINSYDQLQRLDVSANGFVGPFPPALLSLPSIEYLNISGNRFTGMLLRNISCNDELKVADLSSNLLTGVLPACLVSKSLDKLAIYSENCFESKDQSQHPFSFCRNQAMAVVPLPHKRKKASFSKVVLLASIVGGVICGVAFVGYLIFFAMKRVNATRSPERPPRRLIEHASYGYSSKLLADARYIAQTVRTGSLGVSSYRTFSMVEIESATNNFEASASMGEGSNCQMYRGMLNDGSMAAILCLKLKKGQSSQSFNGHIELISKLRHHHLASARGHCFEYYVDDSSVSRLFLIFEYVPNGTLRSRVSEGASAQKLTWAQRIAAAIGVAKGIQFLQAGIIPGLFANDLKITKILLDDNLVAKICSYNLPILRESSKSWFTGGSSSNGAKDVRETYMDKFDIYDFGVILLEIISGRPVNCQEDIDTVKDELQESTSDGASRMGGMVDPTIRRACSDESLRTVVEIAARCLAKEPAERPSIDGVLWNLQFAAQVQEGWRGDSVSSEGSPFSPPRPTKLVAVPRNWAPPKA